LTLIFATAAFAADAPPVGPKAETPVVAKSPETTPQRLLDADKEQQNWITHHKDYSAQRFSTLDQINAGKFKPRVDRVFPLSQIVEAHRYMESNEQIGKIVVTV